MSGVAIEIVDPERDCDCGCGTPATHEVTSLATGWTYGTWCRPAALEIALKARLQQLRDRAS